MTPHADGHVVSVVIPTVNRGSLERTLEAVKAQTRPPDAVVVVEDTDRRGPSWARNEGIRRSRGDLVAFTDDDCVPPPDWLERLIDAIDRHGAAAAGGGYQETDDLLRRKFERKRYPNEEMPDTEGWVGNGGNIMIGRAWLGACLAGEGHIFNEVFGIGEDNELVHRLRRRGAKIVFVPNPVKHLRRMTPMGYFAFQFRRGRGIAHLYEATRGAGAKPEASLRGVLWRQRGPAKWGAAVWKKAIGPFDQESFAGPGQFAVFWIGEKFEGAGFLFELAMRRLAGGRGKSRGPAG